jgi:hypothetical protein
MKRITLLTLAAKPGSMNTLFSYFEGDLEDFLTYVKKIKDNRLVKVRLSSVESFCHVLDNYAVKHIMHRHGGKKERLRGQEPVTEDDFFLIPEIILCPDSQISIQCKNGNPGKIYTKDLEEQTYILIEEIRKGHSEMAITTLYKRKKKLTDAKSPK